MTLDSVYDASEVLLKYDRDNEAYEKYYDLGIPEKEGYLLKSTPEE